MAAAESCTGGLLTARDGAPGRAPTSIVRGGAYANRAKARTSASIPRSRPAARSPRRGPRMAAAARERPARVDIAWPSPASRDPAEARGKTGGARLHRHARRGR